MRRPLSIAKVRPSKAPRPFPTITGHFRPGQHNLAPTGSTALAVPARAGGTRGLWAGRRPSDLGATSGADDADGAWVGEPLFASSCVETQGVRVLSNFRAIVPPALSTSSISSEVSLAESRK